MNLAGRALHFVFKVGDRAATIEFYRDILGMKVLRHEEFSQGCEAQCNGAYENRWSKTMMGYGPEDNHFVVELTYNYPVKSYKLGNDFIGLQIQSPTSIKRAESAKYPIEKSGSNCIVKAPGGYPIILCDGPEPSANGDPVQKVILASSDLERTISYWSGELGLDIKEKTNSSVTFAFGNGTCLQFQDIGKAVDHAEAYGRIAFSIPTVQLAPLQEKMDSSGQKILTRLISLDTPGKATVSVVILADPDGHEICFVGDEGFRELSKVDPKADEDLRTYIKIDKKLKNYFKKFGFTFAP